MLMAEQPEEKTVVLLFKLCNNIQIICMFVQLSTKQCHMSTQFFYRKTAMSMSKTGNKTELITNKYYNDCKSWLHMGILYTHSYNCKRMTLVVVYI